MPISQQALHKCIHDAGFPAHKRRFAFDVINAGLLAFRNYQKRWYYGLRVTPGLKPTIVLKPTTAHTPPKGRYNQSAARFVLIAALARAWYRAFGKAPTLNHKNHPDSDFAAFAIDIMTREGIGRAHRHLEAYWSYARKQVNDHEAQEMAHYRGE